MNKENSIKEFRSILLFLIFGFIISSPIKLHAQQPEIAIHDSIYLMKDLDPPMLRGTIIGMATITALQTKYPEVKKKDRKKGTVLIKIILDENGTVTNPVITESLGKEYDDEALRMIKVLQNQKWEIGLKDGKPVKVSILLPFDFDYKKMKK
ncbi:MAG TPA: energy transducer TonB [Chitinophagales bacterium]|nr:energy transducer TonB [Chitinophagales bacterium]